MDISLPRSAAARYAPYENKSLVLVETLGCARGLSLKVRRPYPLPSRELSAGATMYEDLEVLPLERRHPSRPYLIVNMVTSLDGKTAIEGGTGTGDVPLESNLVRQEADPRALVLVPGGLAADVVARLRRHADVLRAPATPSGAVDLGEALRTLKAERGVELLLVEDSPSLIHSLFSGGLADELFLTLAPKLLGGTSDETPTILEGPQLPAGEWADPHLLSAHLAGGELFLRYGVGALRTQRNFLGVRYGVLRV